MGCASIQSDKRAGSPPLVELSDIHGFWGGDELTIHQDGNVHLKRVTIGALGGKIEKHYRRRLTADEILEWKSFIKSSGYFEYRQARRMGVPDEAHPEIAVNFDGLAHKSAKWAGDDNRKFDLLYKRLMALADQAAKSRPVKVRYGLTF